MGKNRDKSRKDRWYLPQSNPYSLLGYCYRRHDRVQVNINETSHSKRIRESISMFWNPSVKSAALDKLEEMIIQNRSPNAYFGQTPPPITLESIPPVSF